MFPVLLLFPSCRTIEGLKTSFRLLGVFRNIVIASTPKLPRSSSSMSAPIPRKERLIWMDLEMTGLDVDTEKILEVGCLVTDEQLQPLGKGVNIIVHQSKETLDCMNDWCIEHHGKSGLTDESLKSVTTVEMAEEQVLSYVREHTEPGISPLAGNTIYMDKRFIEKFMPALHQHLHYRIVDVSTVKELCRRWYPEVFENAPKKRFVHRSLDDIHDSIAELLYYRASIFKG